MISPPFPSPFQSTLSGQVFYNQTETLVFHEIFIPLLGSLLSFCQSVGIAQNSTDIIFDDPAFEATVREQLQWSGLEKDHPITQNHLDGITFLWLDEDGEDRVRNLMI